MLGIGPSLHSPAALSAALPRPPMCRSVREGAHVGITRGRGWPIIPILGKRRWQDELWTDFEIYNTTRGR